MALDRLVPELTCSDLQKSVDFYVGRLGFKVLYQRPEEKFVYLDRDGAHIMIQQSGTTREWITADLSYPFGRGINFQIPIADVVSLYDSLRKAGYSFFLELEEKWYRKDTLLLGNRQFIIQDPDGYLLRFAQDLGSKLA
jgi:catechol 2,3-dioxygenase-like lactoylglutathione lyase family enzyme